MLSTRLHASPSRRGVPAQLPLGSTEQQLSLALISPGSLVSAMSERFVRGALGTRGGPHPLPGPAPFGAPGTTRAAAAASPPGLGNGWPSAVPAEVAPGATYTRVGSQGNWFQAHLYWAWT